MVELAGRRTRLVAVILDALVILVPLFLAAVVPGAYEAAAEKTGRGSEPSTGFVLFIMLFILGVAIALICLLTVYGRTIGKKMLGIRIVKVDTCENGGFLTNVLLRGFVPALIGAIPLLGPLFSLVDCLLIFREDRRRIHDLIAGTQAIRASPERLTPPAPPRTPRRTLSGWAACRGLC
jgi:uncharacterized RDD family membrane protein YckC